MPEGSAGGLDGLKRAFKNIFKRSKKSKPEPPPKLSTTPSPPPIRTTGSPGPPPQLPPISQSSPIHSVNDSKPLPPTHPLATGTHTDRHEAVPQKHDARPGPPPGALAPAAARRENPMAVKQDEPLARDISPAPPSPLPDASKRGESLGLHSHDDHHAPSPVSHISDDVEPSSTTENIERQVSPPEKQDSPMGGSTNVAEPHKENIPPKTNGVPDSEEKVAVLMDEPPPIKAARSAPGMSATSGPLEDFPEGGFHIEEDDH